MPTTKKTADKKTVKAAATAKPAAKKAAPAKAQAAAKKTAPAKKAPAAAKPVKSASKPATKPAKSSTAKPVAKPAPKKAQPAAKAPAKSTAKPKAAASPVKKAPAAKPKQPEAVKVAAPKPISKQTKSKESISVAIKKPVKKKVAPLKEVKVPKTSVKTSKPYEPNYQPLEDRKAADGANELMIRYSDAELEEFKVLINKKLADASREVAYLQGIITRKDDMGGDVDGRYMTMEDGTVSMEREQMSQMVSRQISFIDNLKKALIRIENKTYGVCRVTGKLIDKARLRAVPHATLSLEAKLGIVKPKEVN
ncbi:RNA polymerase-binding transcription factor DksA [Arachidicoccus rhizosphaerae]|uniref:RNA polymerase-binding transcription factor DksA n=1 Tax=Arachidicoccus rhizosphaerae TaxID=551991 RepID=A0A1H4B2T3_9BACT|nr:TraR/DksA C4-type zinc finger protein [Arachidicoccus rhizosphaerae]SEA42338.1 RNA polymerase-binding transcription factor DksA [Arachidicoccus rhizosphaerae]